MRKTITTLLATTAIAIAAPAFAADSSYESKTSVKHSEDGSYKKEASAESKDATGTKSTTTVKQDKDVDSSGDSTRTTTVEKTSDPKGLLNKQTDKTKETVKVRDGKTKVDTKHTVNGDTVEDKSATY